MLPTCPPSSRHRLATSASRKQRGADRRPVAKVPLQPRARQAQRLIGATATGHEAPGSTTRPAEAHDSQILQKTDTSENCTCRSRGLSVDLIVEVFLRS